MVTAELAVAIVGLVVVLVMLLFAIGVGVTHARTQEAARVAARGIARGDSEGAVVAAAQAVIPGSSVDVRRGSGRVRVDVTKRLTLPLIRVGSVLVRSYSIAAAERQ